MSHLLSELTRGEILARARNGAIGLIPIGALEQHGAHLPVGTDAILVQEICLRAARRANADVLVAPSLWTGYSPHHLRFGATASVRATTFLQLVQDLVRTVRVWLPRLVLVNGHGGNRSPLNIVALDEGCPAISYWDLVNPALMSELFPSDRGSIGHAGQAETSLMLAVAPAIVDTPSGAFEPIRRENEPFLVPDMGASGVLGNPFTAASEPGERFIDAVTAALADYLDQLPNPKDDAI